MKEEKELIRHGKIPSFNIKKMFNDNNKKKKANREKMAQLSQI